MRGDDVGDVLPRARAVLLQHERPAVAEEGAGVVGHQGRLTVATAGAAATEDEAGGSGRRVEGAQPGADTPAVDRVRGRAAVAEAQHDDRLVRSAARSTGELT